MSHAREATHGREKKKEERNELAKKKKNKRGKKKTSTDAKVDFQQVHHKLTEEHCCDALNFLFREHKREKRQRKAIKDERAWNTSDYGELPCEVSTHQNERTAVSPQKKN